MNAAIQKTVLLSTAALTVGLIVGLWAPSGRAQDAGGDAYVVSYEAEAAYDYAGAIDAMGDVPSTSRGYFFALRMGWLHYLSGEYTESIDAYARAAAAEPQAIEPLLGAMLPQMALRQWSDAEDTAEDVLAMDPHNATCLRRLAYVYFSLGRYDDAESRYREVLAAWPSDLEMRTGLGWTLLRQGRLTAAAEEFAAVLSVSPNYEVAVEGMIATATPM